MSNTTNPNSISRGRFLRRVAASAATIPRSIGDRAEWVQACKDRKPKDAKAGFAYSGPFTEALLAGNLATRLQKRIDWDAVNMRAKNAPEADAIIRKQYRTGFGIQPMRRAELSAVKTRDIA